VAVPMVASVPVEMIAAVRCPPGVAIRSTNDRYAEDPVPL
jgi:hypothetical protein